MYNENHKTFICRSSTNRTDANGVSVSHRQYPANTPLARAKRSPIEDAFWSPKLDIWRKITTNDVLNKFEGKYTPFPGSTDTRNAFRNFDRVAEGQRDIKQHDGPEWYDGLVYESIRGIADFLASHPNKELEKRIDGYVDRIYAAQQTEPTGYINTHTQLMENNHRWGDNGDSFVDNTMYTMPGC